MSDSKSDFDITRNRFSEISLANSLKGWVISLSFISFGLVIIILRQVTGASGDLREILGQIGTVLISSGATSGVYQLWLRRTFIEEMKRQLGRAFRSAFFWMEETSKSGIRGAPPVLPTDEFANGMKGAQKSVRILQTWIGNFISLEESVKEALRNGVSVRILLLNPDSIQAKAREKDIYKRDSEAVVESWIKANITQLALIRSQIGDGAKLEVRLYDATPVITIYSYDDTSYVGFFWRERSAIQGPQIMIKGRGSTFEMAIDMHFESLWKAEDTETVGLAEFYPSSSDEPVSVEIPSNREKVGSRSP